MKITLAAAYFVVGALADCTPRTAQPIEYQDTEAADGVNDNVDCSFGLTYDPRDLQFSADFQTELLKDINPGPASSFPRDRDCISIRTDVCPGRAVCDLAFYIADDGIHGPEPWVSDGTPQGTVFLKDVNPGPSGIEIGFRYLLPPNKLFFTVDDGGSDGTTDLWVTDGTTPGTRKVNLIHDGAVALNPAFFQPLHGLIYFFAWDPMGGIQLWRSDGTDFNTVRVTNLPGGFVAYPSALVDVNNHNLLLFDPLSSGGDLRSLWSTDGTEAGTIQLMGDVIESRLSRTGRSPSFLESKDHVYFGVTDVGGSAMWRSDGTPSGTVMVMVGVLPYRVNRRWLDAERTLFSTRSDELWVTDGSSAGTLFLMSFSDIGNFFGRNGVLADNGNTGQELFFSDGTTAGTFLYFEFVAGPQGIDVDTGSTLYCDGPTLFGFYVGNTYQIWAANRDFDGPLPAKVREFVWNGETDHTIISMGFNAAIITGYDSTVGVELWKVSRTGPGSNQQNRNPSGGFCRPIGLGVFAATLFVIWMTAF